MNTLASPHAQNQNPSTCCSSPRADAPDAGPPIAAPGSIVDDVRTGDTPGDRDGPPVSRLHLGEVVVDLERNAAFGAGYNISLTKTEYAILRYMARRLRNPVSRDELLQKVWGYNNTYLATRTVDTHVYRLRKKINDVGKRPRWIRKAYGAGYVLDCDVE